MDIDIVKGHWREIKGKLQQQFGKITDDELKMMEGNYNELEGFLQKKYGYSKDEARKRLDEFLRANRWEH